MKIKTALSVFAAIVISAGLILIYSNGFAEKGRVAVLSNVKGTVTLKAAGSTQWTAATDRMEISEGDELRTEGGSSAIIRMDDGSMIKLGPLANMKVSGLKTAGRDNNTMFDISKGKSWNRVRKLTDKSVFKVATPTAVAGVRGTFFSTDVAQSTSSTIDVFDGQVAVSSASNPNASVNVGAHYRTTVDPGQSPASPSQIPSSEEQAGRNGFSQEEFAAAAFDIQISVSPQVVEPGKTAVVNVQTYMNGQPYRKELKISLSLSGSATFVSTGTNEIEATTDNQGALKLEITSPEKETVTVSAQLHIKVRK
ncbi:MAG TPA: FecR family protein [bacterium]|nr:FecR family protein [bacterium]